MNNYYRQINQAIHDFEEWENKISNKNESQKWVANFKKKLNELKEVKDINTFNIRINSIKRILVDSCPYTEKFSKSIFNIQFPK